MPSSPLPDGLVGRTDTANGNATTFTPPPPSNTRALLQSLEELRDSLSVRVNHLATAVERLREQAGELERSVGQPRHTRRDFSGSLQLSARQAAQSAMSSNGSPTSPAHTTTSAIASEVSNLDRPITSAEIHRLLDRASASLAETPNLSAAEMEGTLDGLRSVQTSLQGGLRDLTEMGETQARLRQRLRTRGERRSEGDQVARQAASTRDDREMVNQMAQRRLDEIRVEAEHRRSDLARGRGERAARWERTVRTQRPAKMTKMVPPTISTPNNPIIVRTSGVTPPPAANSTIRPKTPAYAPESRTERIRDLATIRSSPRYTSTRNSLSHLDAASLDALHTQIAELDLNLEPADYMSGLSRIIRRAINPRSAPAVDRVDMMIMDDSGNILHDSLPGWGPPESPLSSSSSHDTNLVSDPDAGLTYRGRDVQDRIRAAPTTPDLGGLLGQDAPVVRTLQDRVAAIMARRPIPEARAGARRGSSSAVPAAADSALDTEADQSLRHGYERLDRIRQDRIQRARDIVRDSTRSVQDAARSARELVLAATAIRQEGAERHARLADREAAYEASVQSELRAAQAQRSRAYNRYQDLVASRARREARPPPAPRAIPPRPPLGTDIGIDAVISVIPVIDPDTEGDDLLDLDEARQQFVAAQMREAAVQQRLLWAQSRLRRETPDTALPRPRRPSPVRDQEHDVAAERTRLSTPSASAREASSTRDHGWDLEMQNGVLFFRQPEAGLGSGRDPGVNTSGVGGAAEGRRTVGPRDELPQDVDSIVRIRQLMADRPRVPDRSEARRQHMANIRQDLAESRRQVREARAGLSINVTSETEGDPSIRQLLDDAQQVNDARRNLYESLDSNEWGVTPSSPITASGTGNYSHIQISVDANSAATRRGDGDWQGDGDEAVRRIAENVLGEGGPQMPVPGYGMNGVVDLSDDTEVGDEQERHSENPAQTKTEVEIPDPTPIDNESVVRTHMWPAEGRKRRRERVYISMLDL